MRWHLTIKQIILIIFIFRSHVAIAQDNNDGQKSMIRKDSAERVIYKLKDSLRRLQYEYSSGSYKNTIDSISYGIDSIVISYKTKTGQLIKKHIKEYFTKEGFSYEVIAHYNSLGQIEFEEHWESVKWPRDSSSYFTWKIYSYDRFVYDNKGRVISFIQFHPEYISRRYVKRMEYKYDENGKQTSTRISIPIEKFWD